MENANREYKDSIFTKLFSDPNLLRELYNAITGSVYDATVSVIINSLSRVLFLKRYNDISFIIDGKLVVLLEHQSTISENLPLRLLLYIAKVYEAIIKGEQLYQKKLLKIPYLVFIVLYNGIAPFPNRKVLRLSAAFEKLGLKGKFPLELTVTVLNINVGHNKALLRRNKTLGDYAKFIAKVREQEHELHDLAQAIEAAVKYCLEHDILQAFLEKYSTEVFDMLEGEVDLERVREVWEAEAKEEGWFEILDLMDQGYSSQQIRAMLPRKRPSSHA
jgi:hypothetical protein